MNKPPPEGVRVKSSSPGHRGKHPRCHDCKRPKGHCRCGRFVNGPKS